MSEDDLYSTDTRALKELRELHAYFIEAGDECLQTAAKSKIPSKRGFKAAQLGAAQAWDLAADAVAASIKTLGHSLKIQS